MHHCKQIRSLLAAYVFTSHLIFKHTKVLYFLMAMPINCQIDTELANRASIIAVLGEIQQIHMTYTHWKQVGFRNLTQCVRMISVQLICDYHLQTTIVYCNVTSEVCIGAVKKYA